MATIAVILATNTDTDLDSAITDWTAAGHTVTKIDDAALDTPGYGATLAANYDLVVWGAVQGSQRITELRSLVSLGTPLLVSAENFNESSGQTLTPTNLGITGTVDQRRASASAYFNIVITDNTHAITSGFGTGNLAVRSGTTSARIACVGSGQSYIGTLLANGSATGTQAGLPTLLAIEAGTSYLDSGVNNARIVYYGNLRADPTEQTANQIALQLAITNWLLATPPLTNPSLPPVFLRPRLFSPRRRYF